MELTDANVKLVQHYAELWHNGRVPDGEARTEFIARMLDDFMLDCCGLAQRTRYRRWPLGRGLRLPRPPATGALAELIARYFTPGELGGAD